MKVKLIKQLDIKYSLIPDLTRAARRLLQTGAEVEVSAECGEFLISKGFVQKPDAPVDIQDPVAPRPGKLVKAQMKSYPKSYFKPDEKLITKNDGDVSSNNEEEAA